MDRSTTTAAAEHRGWHFRGRPLGLLLIFGYKLVWGIFEVAAGTLAFFSSRLIMNELIEDPQDVFLTWLLTHAHIDTSGLRKIGVFIVIVGITNLLLAAGLWYRSWKLRNVLLIFYSALAAYGLFHLSEKPTVPNAAFVLIDLLITFYLWKLLPKHLVADA
jgi:uncharacterized membrane protein